MHLDAFFNVCAYFFFRSDLSDCFLWSEQWFLGMLCVAFGLQVYERRKISNLCLVRVGLVAPDYFKFPSVRVNTISYHDFNHELPQTFRLKSVDQVLLSSPSTSVVVNM